jgi:hypothetical protein
LVTCFLIKTEPNWKWSPISTMIANIIFFNHRRVNLGILKAHFQLSFHPKTSKNTINAF